MDWPNMAPKCLPRLFGHQKFNPKKSGPFHERSGVFGRKSQQNLVYRCSLGRFFFEIHVKRTPSNHIIPPPHPHFKAPALSVVQGKVMCCEPQRFVCENNTSQTYATWATLEKRNDTCDMKMRQDAIPLTPNSISGSVHLLDPSISISGSNLALTRAAKVS